VAIVISIETNRWEVQRVRNSEVPRWFDVLPFQEFGEPAKSASGDAC
jgi:hypothetical protein